MNRCRVLSKSDLQNSIVINLPKPEQGSSLEPLLVLQRLLESRH